MINNIHLFLDIDGVLATTAQFYSKKRHPIYDVYSFDKKCVKVLNEILHIHKPTLILSSDWKLRFGLNDMNIIFKENGIDYPITDTTRNLWRYKYFNMSDIEVCRADEIMEYVEDYSVKNYLAIDDLDLTHWLKDNFIHIPRQNEGIKQSNIKEKILTKLNLMLS